MKAFMSQVQVQNLGGKEETTRPKSRSLQLKWFTELKQRKKQIKLKAKYKMTNLLLNVHQKKSSKFVTTTNLDRLLNLEHHWDLVHDHKEKLMIKFRKLQLRLAQSQRLENHARMLTILMSRNLAEPNLEPQIVITSQELMSTKKHKLIDQTNQLSIPLTSQEKSLELSTLNFWLQSGAIRKMKSTLQ